MFTFSSLLSLNAHANFSLAGILKGCNNTPKLTIWPPKEFWSHYFKKIEQQKKKLWRNILILYTQLEGSHQRPLQSITVVQFGPNHICFCLWTWKPPVLLHISYLDLKYLNSVKLNIINYYFSKTMPLIHFSFHFTIPEQNCLLEKMDLLLQWCYNTRRWVIPPLLCVSPVQALYWLHTLIANSLQSHRISWPAWWPTLFY